MKRFHYPLDVLLRLKRQQQRVAERKQHEARRAMEATREHERSCDERLRSASADLSQCLGVTTPADEYLGRQDIVQAMLRELWEARRRVSATVEAWQQARRQLLDLNVQVDSLEMHRSGKWREYVKEQGIAAQHEMDDFVLRRWSQPAEVEEEEISDNV